LALRGHIILRESAKYLNSDLVTLYKPPVMFCELQSAQLRGYAE